MKKYIPILAFFLSSAQAFFVSANTQLYDAPNFYTYTARDTDTNTGAYSDLYTYTQAEPDAITESNTGANKKYSAAPQDNTSSRKENLKHNPWSLIIYRSENDPSLNAIRCLVKITDEDGNDAFGTKVNATYEWTSIPGRVHSYRKTRYLLGGMAMHLVLKRGKYRISVHTPEDDLAYFPGEAKSEWKSNEFLYDTQNPAKVIFVYPAANENGFYSGEWIVGAFAPKWFRFTKPVM